MDIRNDRQKGLNYTEIGKKYHLDPRTAKRYALSETKPAYQLIVWANSFFHVLVCPSSSVIVDSVICLFMLPLYHICRCFAAIAFMWCCPSSIIGFISFNSLPPPSSPVLDQLYYFCSLFASQLTRNILFYMKGQWNMSNQMSM